MTDEFTYTHKYTHNTNMRQEDSFYPKETAAPKLD